jgi:hypothetical protein
MFFLNEFFYLSKFYYAFDFLIPGNGRIVHKRKDKLPKKAEKYVFWILLCKIKIVKNIICYKTYLLYFFVGNCCSVNNAFFALAAVKKCNFSNFKRT